MQPIALPEIVTETFTPYLVENLSNEDYHADRTALSSTTLKTVLKSPASFLAYVSGLRAKPSPALRIGSIIHEAVLEPASFKSRYVVEPEFGDQRNKLNKQAKADWLFDLEKTKPNAVVVTEEELRKVEGIVNSVMRHTEAANLIKRCQVEKSGYFRNPDTGIKCRIRPDLFDERMGVLVDLKSTQDASIDYFSREICKRHYDLSLAQYREGLELITGRSFDFMAFIAVEKEPPYEVALYLADQKIKKKGRADYLSAIKRVHECLMSGEWPGRQQRHEEISLPKWVEAEGDEYGE